MSSHSWILRRFSLFLILLLANTGCMTTLSSPSTWPKYRFEKNLSSSVRLESESWFGPRGSGVIVHSSKERGTYILTNRHVAEVIARDQDFIALVPNKERSRLFKVEVEPFFPSTKQLLEESIDESNEALDRERARQKGEMELCEREIKRLQLKDQELLGLIKKLNSQESPDPTRLDALQAERQEMNTRLSEARENFTKRVLESLEIPFENIFDLALVKVKSELLLQAVDWPTQFPFSKENHYFLAMAPQNIPTEVKLDNYEPDRSADSFRLRLALFVDSEKGVIPGNSGGGVFNDAHELSGLVAWGTKSGAAKQSGIVPFSAIMKWLIANKLDWVAKESVHGWKKFQESAQ